MSIQGTALLARLRRKYTLDLNIHSEAKLPQATLLDPVFLCLCIHDASLLLKRFTLAAVSFNSAQESQEQATVVISVYDTDIFKTYSTTCFNM